MSEQGNPVGLNCTGLVKTYSGVTVLKSVDFALRPSTVVGLIGENGAGKSTLSSILITDLPELGILSNRQIAALVGVAPFARDTGKSTGKRFCKGGRNSIRRVLYMATIAATNSCVLCPTAPPCLFAVSLTVEM